MMTMRRSGSFQPPPPPAAAAPRSGDSYSSSNNAPSYSLSHARRSRRRKSPRKQHQQVVVNGWTFVLRMLLLIAGCLILLDVALLYKSDENYKQTLEEELPHMLFAERPPPRSVKGDGDDHNVIDKEEDDVDYDKEPIFEILRQARIDPAKLSEEVKRKLPTWSTVQRLYGDSPRIHGLDTCAKFREITEPSLTFLAMAGTFNSGTNLLASLMIHNCQIDERMAKYGEKQKGMRWQVKWGKHTPVQFREQHVTRTDKDVPIEYTLPLITIRDPYNWMQSNCRHPYEMHWDHSPDKCPHVWNERTGRTSRVQVNYAEATTHHSSLPGMWNDWYNEYMQADFPRVVVRMEDLIFYGKEVTETLCKCGGGSPRQKQFHHISESAKLGTAQHGSDKTSLVEAMIRYGTDVHRLDGMTPKDLEVTREILDPKLMEIFNYKYAY